ncbi:S-adenosyl-L-methionine-dependent methyltransferase [Talaromyces proteolyticus]|uniref:S-adenosyl-L-methionine-dependent methyltransferase n=1 Tax=Talaromyces proteolyticus TaxID=1131652 RepID=A0AAD4KJL9_9EURO|nr:S-adenosyl-L-methionine-dependent methyltransferase [Talaromyces proteolyticus]KAH8692975.1 S-adenosyl-L-methionine-dependent methyltransferase [Talaromyces proteolyticus]
MCRESRDDGIVDPIFDVRNAESSDGDSAYEEGDINSMTTSLSSSVLTYVYENGRRYHQLREGNYIFPNDEKEQDRLDMLHHIYSLAQGGRLHIAPISNPQRALDMGTGTGIWALDFADEYPETEVMGVDVTPIQPQWAAPNCRFIIDDLEEDWDYSPSQRFDYIHQRSMAGSIGNWPRLYQQALQNLNPNGWIEIQEFDVWFYSQVSGGLPEDSSIMKWQKLIDQGSKKLGRPLNYASQFAKNLEDAGFEDVRTEVVKTPIGTWPKDPKLRELGAFLQVQMNEALEAVTLGYFTRVLGWSDLETQVMLAHVKKEFNDRSKLLYTFCRYVVGHKPGQSS